MPSLFSVPLIVEYLASGSCCCWLSAPVPASKPLPQECDKWCVSSHVRAAPASPRRATMPTTPASSYSSPSAAIRLILASVASAASRSRCAWTTWVSMPVHEIHTCQSILVRIQYSSRLVLLCIVLLLNRILEVGTLSAARLSHSGATPESPALPFGYTKYTL